MKRISIVGVENSGKSVLMAVLGAKFKSSNRCGLFLESVDESTFMHYNELVEKMRRGEWPGPTLEGTVLNLRWKLMRSHKPYPEELAELHFLDFAGEDYRSAFGNGAVKESNAEAVETLRSHVSGSDVLLVLMNVNDVIVDKDDIVAVQRMLHVQWLTQTILKYAHSPDVKVKECAIVFTNAVKWEHLLNDCGGPQGVLQKHLPNVASSYPEVPVLAVSAVNDTEIDENGHMVPVENFSSTGLDELMEWIARKVSRRLVKWVGMLVMMPLVFFMVMVASELLCERFLGQGRVCSRTEVQTNGMSGANHAQDVHSMLIEPKEPGWNEGDINPRNPNLVASNERNVWKSVRPGYVWVNGTDDDEWKPGMIHPQNEKLKSDVSVGVWRSIEPGYVWAGDAELKWKAGIEHRQYPHVFSSENEGSWHPESGFDWIGDVANGDYSVKWIEGKVIGRRKTGKYIGEWYRTCRECEGVGKVSHRLCNGEGSVKCNRCDGGRIGYKDTEPCTECDGSGKKRCPNECVSEGSMVGVLGVVMPVCNVGGTVDYYIKPVCYGYLPTKVPEERKAEMTEFLFRAECAYGFSPATIVFECDGSVRCQTWCPLSEFENAPEIAKRRLAGSVMEKLFAYSRSVGEVLLGGNGTVAASRNTPATMFEKVSVDSKADMAEVLKICFPDGGYETSADAGGWLGSRFGNGDGSVGFIEARIDDVRKDIGGIYETLEYALVVRDGMVCNVCQFPVEIPKDRLGAVADLAMRLNESLKYAHFGVDFENGKLWSHYSLPVSALASEGGSGERQNLYPMWIKIQTILNVAKNSEAFSELLRGE